MDLPASGLRPPPARPAVPLANPRLAVPVRDLALATFLSRLHADTTHHLSASECESLPVADLLALATDADGERWNSLTLAYTDPIGPIWLRQAIAATYTAITPLHLMCFAGAQEALYAALHALLSPNDHAIVVLPCYQSMETLPLCLCAVTGIPLDVTDNWSLDLDRLAAAIRPNTRLIAISFPNNPTGKQLEQDRFRALVALCRRHGIWLLSDEVYRLTEYNDADRLPAAADVYERGISLGAMSKAYGLPGLRIAWVACRDPALLTRLATIRQYLSTCSAAPSEVLATIALHAADTILARNRARTLSNLTLLRAFLDRHPTLFTYRPPDGGMVCYPRYTGPDGVEAFVIRMAQDASVLLLPASVFHSDLADLPSNHLRFGVGRAGVAAGLAALEAAIG